MRDHLAPDYVGPQFATTVALASLAGVTSELRFGTLVIVNDFPHPTVLAKEAATLDVLTGGRFELGIGAGQPRMLRLAGRHADIVGLLTASVSSGVITGDPTARRTDAVRGRIDHIREGAGDRFEGIELSVVPEIVITANREGAARQLIVARGWSGLSAAEVFDMPAIFIGSEDDICAQMEKRRADLGISSFVVQDRRIEELAPIVARLRAR